MKTKQGQDKEGEEHLSSKSVQITCFNDSKLKNM
jgi:hypothetical protein